MGRTLPTALLVPHLSSASKVGSRLSGALGSSRYRGSTKDILEHPRALPPARPPPSIVRAQSSASSIWRRSCGVSGAISFVIEAAQSASRLIMLTVSEAGMRGRG